MKITLELLLTGEDGLKMSIKQELMHSDAH
jgi:hypothetical protein